MLKFTSILLTTSLLLSFTSQALEFLTPVQNQHWLLSSEGSGLVMLNNKLESVASVPGRYEQSASVSLNKGQTLLAAINEDANSLDLFQWDGKTLQLLDRQQESLLAVSGVCFYKDPTSQHIHAFINKEHSAMEQRIVFDMQRQKVVNLPVRTIPVPDAISACAVNNQAQTLYLAEEGVGIWQLSADPETDALRSPVAMHTPFGQLDSVVESLTVLDDGSLVIPQQETSRLVVISAKNKQQVLSLSALTEAVAVTKVDANELLVITGESLTELTLNKVAYHQQNQEKAQYFPQVHATDETAPVAKFGDAADDPAIWFNPSQPSASLILGTDKKRGLAVYNLQGSELQFLEVGRINNVDLRPGFEYKGNSYTLATASQRDNNSIALFFIDSAGLVSFQGEVATSLDEVYGLCMYQPKDSNEHHVFINDKDGRYQQYRINPDMSGDLLREFTLIDQPEGCVTNDHNGDLFMGVENKGIWFASADADSKDEPKMIIEVGGKLKDDVEGMALYQMPDKNYLVVSSQGNNSYAIYDAAAPFDYLGSFQVAANLMSGIDGASETDGLDVSGANFGGEYHKGLLVVQDGRNVMPAETQNFKVIAFDDIASVLSLKLED